jgi:hypothetical protein
MEGPADRRLGASPGSLTPLSCPLCILRLHSSSTWWGPRVGRCTRSTVRPVDQAFAGYRAPQTSDAKEPWDRQAAAAWGPRRAAGAASCFREPRACPGCDAGPAPRESSTADRLDCREHSTLAAVGEASRVLLAQTALTHPIANPPGRGSGAAAPERNPPLTLSRPRCNRFNPEIPSPPLEGQPRPPCNRFDPEHPVAAPGVPSSFFDCSHFRVDLFMG